MRLLALTFALTTALAIPSPKHAHLHRSVHDLQSPELDIGARDDVVTAPATATVEDDCTKSTAQSSSTSGPLKMPQAYGIPEGWVVPTKLASISASMAAAAADALPTSAASPPAYAAADSTTSEQAPSATAPTVPPTSSADAAAALPQAPETTADSNMGQTSSTAALAATSIASVKPSASAPSSYSNGALPFSNMVIFGDNLSDRGNGSSDHQVAGNPETIYGFKTWTNGPIAAEVLANGLKVPIKYDYAYGHAAGGSKFGATVNNDFTKSDAGAPSGADQIANYTSNGNYYSKDTVAKTLHFLWLGNNDVLPWAMPAPQSSIKVNQSHIFFGSGADSGNQQFATTLATLITNQARTLIAAGAEHIFVPNVYPRHVAPVVAKYFGLDAPSVSQYGKVIQNTNDQVKQMLSTLKTKGGRTPVYYDAFGFLMNLYNAAKASQANGIKYVDMPGKDICDGATAQAVPGTSNWDLCQVQHHADEFFWMQYLDPTAKVHALLAADMQRAVQAAYAKS